MCLWNAGRNQHQLNNYEKLLNKKEWKVSYENLQWYCRKRPKKSYVNAAGPRNKERRFGGNMKVWKWVLPIQCKKMSDLCKARVVGSLSTRLSLSLNVVLFYPESFDFLLISFWCRNKKIHIHIHFILYATSCLEKSRTPGCIFYIYIYICFVVL